MSEASPHGAEGAADREEVDEDEPSSSRRGEERLRVYVSSTLGELKPEREAAKSAIKTLRLTPAGVDLGRHAGSEDDELAKADIFVGIYWQSYGWTGEPATASILEDEYLRGYDIPRLIYVKEPASERDPRLDQLIDQMRSEGATVRSFEAPGDLAEMLVDDLAALMSERFASPRGRDSLPEGTLTFMFGDISGSTRLVERLGPEYGQVLAGYHAMVAAATDRHGGTVLDLEGERIFSVFPAADEGIRAAVEVQLGLIGTSWPGGVEVRARLGLHTGTARLGSGSYVGLDVHRASRIASAAHGGQILVSSVVRELAASLEDKGLQIRDLGSYALKGLSRSERLYQVEAPGLPLEFPPPRARSTTRVQLPVPQTPLVGRNRELTEVTEMLASPRARLVTLTGPGGIGKTRLAVAVAEALAPDFPDGVYFVNLAPITDATQVLLAIGNAAGIPIEGEPIDALTGEFQSQQVLLLVDNFEQVVAAGPDVGELLGRSPGVKVLATSRVPLRIMSEYEYSLEPLGLPAPGSDQADTVSASDAVRLFLDRALTVLPGFSLDEDNASPIASIVRIVDGVPLAIELAAARLRMLTPKALRDRLSQSLDALGAAVTDVPGRQRTLDAAIDWSYQLLTQEEREVFTRLCVFSGGFTVESAQEVAVDEGGDAIELLMGLVENSLVLSAHGGEGRLRLLAPIREFGLRRLEESGDYERVRDRHAAYFVGVAEAALDDLRGPKQAGMVETLSADWNNFDSAAEWLAARNDQASLVRLAYGLWVFAWVANHLRDALRWLAPVDDPGSLPPLLEARYRWLSGGIAYEMGQYEQARQSIDASLDLLESNGDIDCHNWADFVSALLMPAFGAEPEETRKRVEVSLSRFQGFGDRWGEGYALVAMGIIASSGGDQEAAERYQLETRRLGEELGNGAMIGLAEAQLGFTYVASGRFQDARDALRRSFDLFRRMNYREGLCYALEAAASLSFTEGQAEMGMIALGAAEEVRERIGLHPWPLIGWLFEAMSSMADGLADPDLQAARLNGRQMNPFEAAALVLESAPVPA